MRRYEQVPYNATHELAGSPGLEDIANVIEGAICAYDAKRDASTTDALYLILMERLMDRYHFGDQGLAFSSSLEEQAFAYLEEAIHEGLPDLSPQELTSIIGTVCRSIRRHTQGGREYVDFVSTYLGRRGANGVRVPKL